MKLIDMTVTDFASEVDSNSPAPGGGSVSALASDIGVGLARMMAHLSFGKKKFEALDDKTKEEFKVRFDKLGEIRTELSTLVDKDTESFNEFMKALKLPKETDEEKNGNSDVYGNCGKHDCFCTGMCSRHIYRFNDYGFSDHTGGR